MARKSAIEFARGRARTGAAKSTTVAQRVRRVRQQREKWKRENAEAIADYNDLAKRRGIFSDGRRTF